jgi:hypothetical protein
MAFLHLRVAEYSRLAGEIRNMRSLGIAVALGVTLAGCAIQRAQVAQDPGADGRAL